MSEQEHNKGGRPSKFTPEICDMLVAFFSGQRSREVQIITKGKNDYEKIETKLVPNELPTFERFASDNDLTASTLVNWAHADEKAIDDKTESPYPGFFAAYKKAKELQRDFIMQNGLMGLYAPAFAIFTAKNITDMRDKVEQEISGKDGGPVQVEYTQFGGAKDE